MLKKNFLVKIGLLVSIALTISSSYSMATRLRLGLEKGLMAAALYRSPSLALVPSQAVFTKKSTVITSTHNSNFSFIKNAFPFSSTFNTQETAIMPLPEPTKEEKGLIKQLMRMPYIYAPEKQVELIKSHSSYIAQTIDPVDVYHRKGWSEESKILINNLLITRINTLITGPSTEEAINFFFDYLYCFSYDQQKLFLKNHSQAVLKNLDRCTINCNKDYKTPLSNFIATYASADSAAKWLLERPDIFLETEQEVIITNHIEAVLNTLGQVGYKYSGLTENSKKKLKEKALSIASEQPNLIFKTLLEVPFIFSQEEQTQLNHLCHNRLSPEIKAIAEIIPQLNASPSKNLSNNQESLSPLQGPLFSNYLKNYPDLLLALLSSSQYSHFYNLLPSIITEVKKEYEKNRIVLFHGQQADWMLLEKIYHALSNLDQKKESPENFVYLRFQQHSSLSSSQAKEARLKGSPYNPCSEADSAVLFTNLHLAANGPYDNSWNYAVQNIDVKSNHAQVIRADKTGRKTFGIRLDALFKDLNLTEEYNQLQNTYPQLFDELFELFTDAIKEKGNHGRFLVISMPEKLAEQITYSTDTHGQPDELIKVEDQKTSCTKKIAQNYDQAPRLNQFAVILSEEIINPEAAKQAGVKIVGFNPAFYFKSEKSLKVLEKIEEIRQLIKKIKESTSRSG